MDSIIKCTHTCIFSHALWYLLKCQCVCVCIWSCLCSVTFDIYNTSWCVHVWPPRAIGGDVVRCVGSLASLSRSVLIKPRLGRSAGAGIIYQNWEGFYALSIQRVLCLPSCSRLRCKLARRRRRLSRVHIVVWPVFFFFFYWAAFVSDCASAMLKWFKLWVTAGTEVTSPRNRTR